MLMAKKYRPVLYRMRRLAAAAAAPEPVEEIVSAPVGSDAGNKPKKSKKNE